MTTGGTLTRPGTRRTRVRVAKKHAFGSLPAVWHARWLVPYFGLRMVEKRYARTFLGWLWIPLRPVLDLAGRALLFGGLLGVDSGDRPYLVFFAIGMASWYLFERTAFWGTRSLELNRAFFRRVQVPRLTAVVGAVIPAAVDFAIYAAIAAIVLGYHWLVDGVLYAGTGMTTLLVVPGLALLVLLGLAVALWTSPAGAHARDIRFTIGYVLAFVFVITPVIYPISVVPDRYRPLAELNPITAPIETVKYALLATAPPTATSLVSTAIAIVVVGVGGLWTFGRAERRAFARLST